MTGLRSWGSFTRRGKADAIKAKLKEILQKEKIDKTLVDYVFVLFDPANDVAVLRMKLVDFLGDKTDPFVEWFIKVISQVDNQVAKAQAEVSTGGSRASDSKEATPATAADKDKSSGNDGENGVNGSKSENDAVTIGLEGADFDTAKVSAVEEKREDDDSHGASSRNSRRHRRHRDQSGDAPRDHGATRGASRMLTKATRDAVKSIQAVGSAGATAALSLSPKEESNSSPVRRVEEVVHDAPSEEDADMAEEPAQPQESNDVLTLEVDAEEQGSFLAETESQPPRPTHQEGNSIGQPISVISGRKRPFEDRGRMNMPVHAAPIPAVAPAQMRAQVRRDSPLIVPDRKLEEEAENLDEDMNNIPGLLVVMPSQSSEALSCIMLGDEERQMRYPGPYGPRRGGHPRFAGFPPGRQPGPRFMGRPPGPPQHQQPPLHPYQQHMYYDEGEEMMEEEDMYNGPPVKRMRPGPPHPHGAPPHQKGPAADTSSVLCKFLPHCARKAGICPFLHPPCRNGKFCRYGATCVYDHTGTPGALAAKRITTKTPYCIYAPFCTQPRCRFLHKQPIMCSFGLQCRMGAEKCAFLHPEDVVGDGKDSSQPRSGGGGGVSENDNDLQIEDYDDQEQSELGTEPEQEDRDTPQYVSQISSEPDTDEIEPTFS